MTDITTDDVTAEENPVQTPDSGLLCLVMMLRFLQLPADPAAADASVRGGGYSWSRQYRAGPRRQAPRPEGAGELAEAEASGEDPTAGDRPGPGRVLFHPRQGGRRPGPDPAAGGEQPETLDLDRLTEIWAGETIFLTRRAQLAGADRRFDFTWFIPAIVKYRKLFGEVLLASFFLQLFGLVTPLFFQVVIDKVLVHRGTDHARCPGDRADRDHPLRRHPPGTSHLHLLAHRLSWPEPTSWSTTATSTSPPAWPSASKSKQDNDASSNSSSHLF